MNYESFTQLATDNFEIDNSGLKDLPIVFREVEKEVEFTGAETAEEWLDIAVDILGLHYEFAL